MKHFTALMAKGSLTPKQRVLLLVHNYATKDTTGKENLTEADKNAISEGWRPKDTWEAQEFNKYNGGWRTEGEMKLDAQGIYLSAENSLLRAGKLVACIMWGDFDKKGIKFLEKIGLNISDDEALDLILKNSGLAFDDVVYKYAFQNISEDLRSDILALCPDAATESQYLDQEEMIKNIFDNKEYLNQEAKEKIADAIIASLRNKFFKIFLEKGLRQVEWWFCGYFGELPMVEIAKKCASDNAVIYAADSEEVADELSLKLQKYAEKHKVEVRELLKNTIMQWLDRGLFVTEYAPVWNSDTKDTCNDADTLLPHKEVLAQWLKAKSDARKMIEGMIDDDQLEVETRERDILGYKERVKIITGTSLYKLDDSVSFAKDFKQQADRLKLFSGLVVFLRNRGFLAGYASLLAFRDIYKKLSVVYEIDMGYKVDAFIDDFKNAVAQLNNELKYISDKMEEAMYRENKVIFPAEVFVDNMLFHLEDMMPGTGEAETHYFDEFKKVLGSDFN